MRRSSTRVTWAIGAGVAVAAAGCGPSLARSDSARPLDVAEFARPPQPQDAGAEAGNEAAHDRGTLDSLAGALAGDATDDPGPVAWPSELIDRSVLYPVRPGDALIVDSLIGHINGRPIFADEFFVPIEDRLMRFAEQVVDPAQLEIEFRSVINIQLREVVQNELLLAEAQASLTPEEQRGVFAWLARMYDEEIRLGGGTKSGAEQRRQKSGQELDQYLGEFKDQLLLNQIRIEKIEPRVIVSWRDIEREYQRRYGDFNPSSSVALARIRLKQSDTALIDAVTRRLEAGEPFAGIAEDLGFADGGAWETFRMGPGGITDIDVSPPMKVALEGLKVGDTTEPLTLGTSVLWLHVAAVEMPEARSIYEPQVQRLLKNAIRAQRSHMEWTRYVNRLLQEGVHDDLDAMSERLYRIAIRRYVR